MLINFYTSKISEAQKFASRRDVTICIRLRGHPSGYTWEDSHTKAGFMIIRQMPSTEVNQETQARTLVARAHLDINRKFARCFAPAGFFKRITRRENGQTFAAAYRIAVSLLPGERLPGQSVYRVQKPHLYFLRLARYSSAARSSEDSSSPRSR